MLLCSGAQTEIVISDTQHLLPCLSFISFEFLSSTYLPVVFEVKLVRWGF